MKGRDTLNSKTYLTLAGVCFAWWAFMLLVLPRDVVNQVLYQNPVPTPETVLRDFMGFTFVGISLMCFMARSEVGSGTSATGLIAGLSVMSLGFSYLRIPLVIGGVLGPASFFDLVAGLFFAIGGLYLWQQARAGQATGG